MNSAVFNIDASQQINLEDLHLTNKQKLQAPPPKDQRIYVGTLQEIKKPFIEEIKPYIESFLSGATTTAGYAGSYGMKALSALGGALWWSYTGIKGLFSKTVQFIQPKFILVTSKDEMSKESNIETIEKLNNKIAVLGLDEYKQLSPMQNGKVQVAVPMDEDFVNYLKKQKIAINQTQWQPNVDPTKTMIIPSQSFSIVFEEIKKSNVPMKVNNYGNFCTFELEGKNEVEYQCINKLKLGNNYLEGYLVPVLNKVESVNSQKSDPPSADNQSMIKVEQVKNIVDQQEKSVHVKSVEGVPLIAEYQLSNDSLTLDFA